MEIPLSPPDVKSFISAFLFPPLSLPTPTAPVTPLYSKDLFEPLNITVICLSSSALSFIFLTTISSLSNPASPTDVELYE